MELIASELDKLAIRRKGTLITREDVELMTIPSDEGIVWKMTDLLSARKKEDALQYAHRVIDRGAEEYKLWAMLLSHLKNVVLSLLENHKIEHSLDYSLISVYFFSII